MGRGGSGGNAEEEARKKMKLDGLTDEEREAQELKEL